MIPAKRRKQPKPSRNCPPPPEAPSRKIIASGQMRAYAGISGRMRAHRRNQTSLSGQTEAGKRAVAGRRGHLPGFLVAVVVRPRQIKPVSHPKPSMAGRRHDKLFMQSRNVMDHLRAAFERLGMPLQSSWHQPCLIPFPLSNTKYTFYQRTCHSIKVHPGASSGLAGLAVGLGCRLSVIGDRLAHTSHSSHLSHHQTTAGKSEDDKISVARWR
jgi:hypothetical protein